MSASGAITPSIEKAPSVAIRIVRAALASSSFASRSAMSQLR